MKEEMRTFGYLCPVCHKSVIAGRSTFALSASGAVISCECGKSSLTVDSDGRRFRLSVPCGLCGEEHTAECDSEQLLRGEGIGLACPQTKALCCFIGEDYAVEREMEQLSLTAAKQREQGEGEDVFLDNVIMSPSSRRSPRATMALPAAAAASAIAWRCATPTSIWSAPTAARACVSPRRRMRIWTACAAM